jgi:hypothetical protein
MEVLRQVAYNPDASRRIHEQQACAASPADEAFHRDTRVLTSLRRRCAVFGAFSGCCYGAASLAVITSVNRYRRRHASAASGFFALPMAALVGILVLRLGAVERRFRSAERAREEWELANYPEGEVGEMQRLYVGRGLTEDEAKTVVAIWSREPVRFVDLMMVDELGFSPVPPPDPRESGIAAFHAAAAFGICAAAPAAASMLSRGASRLPPIVALVAATVACGLARPRVVLGAYATTRDAVVSLVEDVACVGGVFATVLFALPRVMPARPSSRAPFSARPSS